MLASTPNVAGPNQSLPGAARAAQVPPLSRQPCKKGNAMPIGCTSWPRSLMSFALTYRLQSKNEMASLKFLAPLELQFFLISWLSVRSIAGIVLA